MLLLACLFFGSLRLPAFAEAPVTLVHAKTFDILDGKFLLDGKPLQIISGEMHYARIPEAYWRHRLRMAKACGLNAITTYVFWNVQEPEKGKFNFKGEADIAKFVRMAQEEGLWVLLRPGPYVCAEWDFGGFPYWLLNEKGMKLRSRDERFLQYVERYLRELGKQLAPLQVTHGGPILMVQAENEYGSYGKDMVYMGRIRAALLEAGFSIPLFTADGGQQMAAGHFPGLLPGLNGGSGPDIKETIDRYYLGGPYFVPEYYPGWLDHWGEPKSKVGAAGVVRSTERMLTSDISFNYYMFHGGTNFGFTNGANFGGNYQPDLTSYDYDAPLDEAGRATPKYLQLRETLQKHLPPGAQLPAIPPANPIIAVPRFELKEAGSLFGALPRPILSEQIKSMEEVGQDYGFILYRTTLQGPLQGKLLLKDLRDYAVVLLNGKRIGLLDRRRKTPPLTVDLPAGKATLDILVENCGRINYGSLLTDNHKGITDSVRIGERMLTGWEIYPLPFKTTAHLPFDGKQTDGPTLRRGHFALSKVGDTFLDMRGWFKGVVWINGHNLGRFWQIGPQQTLYAPGCWLKPGENEVMVLDLAPNGQRSIEGLTEPILTELHPEEALHKSRPAPAVLPAPRPEERIVEGEFTRNDGPQDVRFGAQTGRYLCFQALTSYEGDYASAAELYLLDAAGKPLSRDNWTIYYADSEEASQEDGSADNLLDDDTATIWHSVWSRPHPSLPHFVVIDLGKETAFSGLRYVARPGDKPAKTRKFALYVSATPFTGGK
ncbi:MAG TPA: beta-galactosidase [Chthonomonadaceae bacterium]|nr:beta-galactosidase [Chthonomonadaceae bacterium]